MADEDFERDERGQAQPSNREQAQETGKPSPNLPPGERQGDSGARLPMRRDRGRPPNAALPVNKVTSVSL